MWSIVNNPLYFAHVEEKTGDEGPWRLEVLKRLPNLKRLDGQDVTEDELQNAISG